MHELSSPPGQTGRDEVVPVAVAGIGSIGQAVAAAVLDSPGLRLVAAIDNDPKLVGRALSEVLGRPAGDLRVERETPETLRRARGGVLLQLTGSRLEAVADQIERAVELGLNVVTSCEEMAFPWMSDPAFADELEEAAARAQVSVLGMGVNPGFVLDRLIVTLGSVAGKVSRVTAERVVDASTRREALQRKIGVGMTREEFERAAAAEEIGHVGLAESAALVSAGLALGCDEFDETLEPVLSGEAAGGRVAGIRQEVRGFASGREAVTLSLLMTAGAPDPHDTIVIEGSPPMSVRTTGIPGDLATVWSLVNAVPAVATAEPGLLTVLDLPSGR